MKVFILSIFILTNLFAAEPHQQNRHNSSIHTFSPSLNRVGDYPYPNDPLLDRAKGYLLKGKAKTAVSNSGNFITWDYHPAGLWNNYAYIPHVGFVAGVPGHEYSSTWLWNEEEYLEGNENINVWSSSDAYNVWVDDIADPENEEGNFKTVVYNTDDDRGDMAIERASIFDIEIDGGVQWVIDHNSEELHLYLDGLELDPNLSSSRIGLAYPWAIRPKFKSRNETAGGLYFDQYEYGADLEEWTDDDEYVYYGANTAESWFTRDSGFELTDWQASTNSRFNTHSLDFTAGELFGNTSFTDLADPDAVLAHSTLTSTWPEQYNFDSGSYEPSWPGLWADEYYGDLPESWSSVGIYDCNGTRADDDCWKPLEGRHISDMDVYMEFDDRWANVGNEVVDNEYVSSGYPMGLKVMATGHSYGVYIAEDIIFFTMKVRNESGDFCAFKKDKYGLTIPVFDNDGYVICDEGMIMPDGTKLNGGAGFDYQKVSMGFYVDADVLSTDATGGFSVHTHEDDFMQYIDCKISNQEYPDGCPTVNDDTLRISMAVIGDYDGISSSTQGYSMEDGTTKGSDFGVVAVQLLDTPYATDPVDLNQDGFIDIFPGEKLKMTDWHWFDWYNRPGVLAPGSSNTPALNKELIQYQVMAGDTTNLTDAEKSRYFHTSDPANDLDSELNPHFDSLEGIKETSIFQDDPAGLDCVFEMTTGPFDLEVGEEVNLSFVVLFGSDMDDLKVNAKTAQFLYNNHYRIFSVPKVPSLTADAGDNLISLSWDDLAESSIDNETGLQDFEGYRLYRSNDAGATWGNEEDMIYDSTFVHVGWQPYVQFDLINDISGPDPEAPWFNLGDNTGLEHSFMDLGLYPYQEYCYALTAYDTGVPPGYEASWGYDYENGFPSSESNSIFNMVCLYPDAQDIYAPPVETLFEENEANIGWSQITYLSHNVEGEYDGFYKFEIQAEIDSNTYLNSETFNPKLFVFKVHGNGNASVESTLYVGGISEDSLNILIDMPGTEYDSVNDLISIPDYLVQGFPIYSIDGSASTDNWLDILGMYVKIENFNALINNPIALVEFEEVIFSDTLLSDMINIKMQWKNPVDIQKQPYFDYQIEFGTTPLDTAAFTSPVSSCDDLPDINTILPFRITNLTLDNQIDLFHTDRGILYAIKQYGEASIGAGCDVCINGMGEECIFGDCFVSEGYANCNWERDETLSLIDILPDGDDDTFYKLKIGFNLEEYYNHVGADPSSTNPWSEGATYSTGEIVYHEGMLWEATEDISIDNSPDEWFDSNGDNINDNPWQILYPWEDGDSATIITVKKLHDGDSWLVDMSLFNGPLANSEPSLLPENFSLSAPYPNPFNPVTQLQYSLPYASNVSLVVYDLMGRQVDILYNGMQHAGYHNVTWNAGRYASGIYFIHMGAGQYVHSQKLMLIK